MVGVDGHVIVPKFTPTDAKLSTEQNKDARDEQKKTRNWLNIRTGICPLIAKNKQKMQINRKKFNAIATIPNKTKTVDQRRKQGFMMRPHVYTQYKYKAAMRRVYVRVDVFGRRKNVPSTMGL